MLMTAKASRIYKIISALTLLLPVSVYLFVSSLITRIEYDYEVNVKMDELSVVELEQEAFIYDTTTKALINGVVRYNDDLATYGIYLDADTVLKAKDGYYTYTQDKDGKWQIIDVKANKINIQRGWKIPLSFVISAMSVFIVLLVISGKMNLQKEHPRLAVLISLIAGTLILAVINTIVGNLLGVFIVASISWGLYYLEWLWKNNKITTKDKTNIEASLLREIKEKIGKYE